MQDFRTELIKKARAERDRYQRLLDNLIEAQKEFGNGSKLATIKTQPVRVIRMKRTKPPRASDETMIVQIIKNSSEPLKAVQIKEEMSKRDRIIADNALSSRLSRLVKSGRVNRVDRGLYQVENK